MHGQPIEEVAEGICVYDFRDAKEFEIIVSRDYESFGEQCWAFSKDGYVTINSACIECKSLTRVFQILSIYPNEYLGQEYLRLRGIFGNATIVDKEKYTDINDQADLIMYEFIPVELQRRQYRDSNIEPGVVRFYTKI